MKLLRTIACLSIFLNFIFPCTAYSQIGNVYTLGVLNLEPKGVSNIEAEILSDELRHQLNTVLGSTEYRISGLDTYEIVERTEMDRLLTEFEFEYSGCVSDSCALELGRMLQADRMVIGTVGRIGETYALSIRLIDIETAKTLNTASQHHRGEIDGLLTTATPNIANDLLYGTSVMLSDMNGISPDLFSESISTGKRKNPYIACALSFIPPVILPVQGIGQYYNGEKTKGHIRLLTGLTSFAMLYYGTKKVSPDWDTTGTAPKEAQNPVLGGIGAIIYIATWVNSSYDAYRSAKRINSSHQISIDTESLYLFAVSLHEMPDSRRIPLLSVARRF